MLPKTKQQLRKHYLQARKLLPDKNKLSALIIKNLIQSEVFEQAYSILLYASTTDEVNTWDLLHYCLYQNKRVFLPILKGVQIGEVKNIKDLRKNKLDIFEPVKTSGKDIYSKIDLAIIPGIVFDLQGSRLGHGTGFYDQLLNKIPTKVNKIALAFNVQVLPKIPQANHDIKMNYLITEEKIINCKN